ncbi:MAG: sulfur carrier protein ThiS [Azospirillum sp.]|nr:sulfur carrier protein ThiS [Azospirillum sp.]
MSDIHVNGERRPLTAQTLAGLLEELEIPPGARFVAVARNDAVVPARRWGETPLAAGDRIEIVRPAQGG